MIAIGQRIPFPCGNNRMTPNGQPRWLAHPILRRWSAALASAGVILLVVFRMRGDSQIVSHELIAVAVLAGSWLAGVVPGIVLGLFAAGMAEIMPASASPAGSPG